LKVAGKLQSHVQRGSHDKKRWPMRRIKRQADVVDDENNHQEGPAAEAEATTTFEVSVEPEELVGRRKFYVELA
jgi:hypothetical protein